MVFRIVTDTAGSHIKELAKELSGFLEPKITKKYSNIDVSILIAFRCLPESYNRKTFIRYQKKDRCLIIDISVKLEDYTEMYKVEQRFHLGNIFIEYLKQALENRSIAGIDSKVFIEDILKWGSETNAGNWFCNEIDWSSDVEW